MLKVNVKEYLTFAESQFSQKFFWFWTYNYSHKFLNVKDMCNFVWKSMEYIQIVVDVLLYHKAKK